jgi:poly(3-hydroxybutyrate) depolymerase
MSKAGLYRLGVAALLPVFVWAAGGPASSSPAVGRASADGRIASDNLCGGNGSVADRAVLTDAPAVLPALVNVVVALHPALTGPEWWRENSGLVPEVATRRFVAVFPSGSFLSWNAGHCCGYARNLGVDDVAYLDAVLTQVKRDCLALGSVVARVFMIGYSNGGIMTYRYAQEGAHVVSGIGVAAATTGGFQFDERGSPRHLWYLEQLSRTGVVVAVHGVDDNKILFDGGLTGSNLPSEQLRWDRSYRASFETISRLLGVSPVEETDEYWLARGWVRDESRLVAFHIRQAGHSYADLGGAESTRLFLDTFGVR